MDATEKARIVTADADMMEMRKIVLLKIIKTQNT